MERTQNYQLNQWSADDRVLRTDFNADNEKIDTALRANADAIAAEKAAREKAVSTETAARTSAVSTLTDKTDLHTILTHYQRETAQKIEVDLSSVNWSQWRQVYLLIQLNGTGVCECGFNGMVGFFSVTLNGSKYCLIMTPLYDASMCASGIMTGADNRVIKDSYTYNQIKYFTLSAPSGSSISSGSVILKGIK